MEIHGLSQLTQALNNSARNFDSEAQTALVRLGNKLLGKVKLKTPVDTGVLRNSWRIKEGDKLVSVFNNVEYAQYVEYGHRVGKSSKVIDGRYMLTKSVDEIARELESEFEIMIDNLWNE